MPLTNFQSVLIISNLLCLFADSIIVENPPSTWPMIMINAMSAPPTKTIV